MATPVVRKSLIVLGIFAVLLLAIAAARSAPVITATDPPSRPKITSVAVTSDPADDVGITIPYRVLENGMGLRRDDTRYAAGDTLLLTVTFDQAVTVTGNPQLNFVMKNASRTAAFRSTDGTRVVFAYPIVAGDEDRNGVSVNADSLALNGGTIQNASGVDADLSHNKLGDQRGHIVDGIAPRISSLRLTNNDYTRDKVLAIGEEVTIRAQFSERLVYASIAGPPQAVIQVGDRERRADWRSTAWGRGFVYVIQEGDLDTDGISIKSNSIDLNGGTIQDKAGNHANLRHSRVADNWEFVVDGVRPTVKKIRITSDPGDDDTYQPGDTIEATVTFSEPMRVYDTRVTKDGKTYTITPTLALNIGGSLRTAEYWKTNGKDVLFTYRVSQDDQDANGISIAANQLSRADSRIPGYGAVIRDDVGTGLGANEATLDHPALADNASHKVGSGSGAQDSPPPPADDELEAPGPVGSVNLAIERGNKRHTVTVSWTPNDTGGQADRYIVWMKPMDGSNGKTRRVSADKLWSKFKVKSGITYRFSVRAQNEAGKGERVYNYITP